MNLVVVESGERDRRGSAGVAVRRAELSTNSYVDYLEGFSFLAFQLVNSE